MLGQRAGRRTAIPFGPWMLLGTALGLVAGEPVVTWYLNLLV
jgi:leader peptidase (prepilin peptidase)/N-methyltransferase